MEKVPLRYHFAYIVHRRTDVLLFRQVATKREERRDAGKMFRQGLGMCVENARHTLTLSRGSVKTGSRKTGTPAECNAIKKKVMRRATDLSQSEPVGRLQTATM